MKFIKLLKYEFREYAFSFLGLNALLAVLMLLVKFIESFNKSESLLPMFLSILVIGVISSLIFSVVIVIKSLYNRLFSSEGYLLMSLPMGIDSILGAKIISAFVWICISSFIAILCAVLFFGGVEVFREFIKLDIFEYADFLRILQFVCYGIFYILSYIMLLLLILALLHTGRIRKHKILLGIVLYFVIGIIWGIIIGIFMFLVEKTIGTNFSLILVYLIESVVFYFIARWCIVNKLEI